MGGPLFRPEIDQLTTLAQMQHQKLTTPSWFPPNKRQKVRETQDTGCIADSQAQACVTSHRDQAGPSPAGSQVHVSKFVQPQQARQQAQPKAQMVMEPEASALLPSGSLQKQSTAIPVEDTPSLER